MCSQTYPHSQTFFVITYNVKHEGTFYSVRLTLSVEVSWESDYLPTILEVDAPAEEAMETNPVLGGHMTVT